APTGVPTVGAAVGTPVAAVVWNWLSLLVALVLIALVAAIALLLWVRRSPAEPEAAVPASAKANDDTHPMSEISTERRRLQQTAPRATLQLVSAAGTRNLAVTDEPQTIGRGAGNDLALSDPRASRDHATILFEDYKYWI